MSSVTRSGIDAVRDGAVARGDVPIVTAMPRVLSSEPSGSCMTTTAAAATKFLP